MTSILDIKKVSAVVTMFFLMMFVFFPAHTYGLESEASKATGAKGTGITYECVDEKGIPGNCDFDDLIRAVKKALNYGISLTLAFTVVVIAYAGYLYMMSGENPAKRKEANEMLTKVAIGIFFILAAWLIVTLISNALLTDSVKNVVPLK